MSHAKMTISLPEETARAVGQAALAETASLSKVIADALRARFKRLQSEEITRQYNEVWGSLTPEEVEHELAATRSGPRDGAPNSAGGGT